MLNGHRPPSILNPLVKFILFTSGIPEKAKEADYEVVGLYFLGKNSPKTAQKG